MFNDRNSTFYIFGKFVTFLTYILFLYFIKMILLVFKIQKKYAIFFIKYFVRFFVNKKKIEDLEDQ